jgi:hypothetical protein
MVLTSDGTYPYWALPLPIQSLPVISIDPAIPDTPGTAGQFLMSDGISASWQTPAGGGTVTSVAINPGTTGLTFTGGPITQAGTFTVSGVLAVENGGTGTNAPNPGVKELPAQTPTVTGKFLMSNGSTAVWDNPVFTGSGTGTVTEIDITKDVAGVGLYITGGTDFDPPNPVMKRITTTGNLGLSGILNVTNGGTGVADLALALNKMLPSQTGKTDQILSTDGTNPIWKTINGTVTSVDLAIGSTIGLTVTGGPVTSTGTLTIGGKVEITGGGTGAADAVTAINNLMPVQTASAGKILGTDGTFVKWVTSSAGSVTSVQIDGSTTGLAFSGGPITNAGTFVLHGTLGLSNGGTGAGDKVAALNNLLPVQATNAGKALTTDGTNVSWSTASVGTVTSVSMDPGTTGLTISGGPITTVGTLVLSGILSVQNGGTGSASPAQALINLLPTQTGQTGKVLQTNGTSASWVTPTQVAAGVDKQVQFNNGGVMGGSTSFTYTSATGLLNVASLSTTGTVDLTGSVSTTAVTVATSTIDCSLGTYFTKTATTALTWTFSTPPVTGKAYLFVLALQNGAVGVQTWPTSVKWAGGTAPTLTANIDLLIFSTHNGGTSWHGASQLNYSA